MLRRAIVHRFSRRRFDASDARFPIDAEASISIVGALVKVTFDQEVNVSGVPPYTKNGSLPTTLTIINPMEFRLGYASAAAAGQVVVVPQRSKSVRTATGGYVKSAAVTF